MTSLTKHHHFGFRGGPSGGVQLKFHGPIPSFIPNSSNDQSNRLSSCSPYTLRELISDVPLEGTNSEELEKPAFLFGDSILVSEESLFEDECKLLHHVGDRMFILEMERSCSLTYLQGISTPRQMELSLTKNQDGIPVGNFSSKSLFQNGPSRCLTSLLLG